ncbi:MAG TPA: cyclase family protein [Candidatus Dormibacteraeota bacterium]
MLIELSQPYSHGMFSQNLFPPVKVERCISIDERGVNVTCISAAVHAGTHVDAPLHFVRDGEPIHALDLERLHGAAVCLEVERGALEEITAADLEAGPPVEPGDIVLIRTGWDRWFATDHDRYHLHPYLSLEAAEWLVERRVKLVGLDVPTPDLPERGSRPPGFDWPVHRLLLGAGVLVAEHLAHLERVASTRFRAYALPVPIVDSDGAPARIVAERA